MITRRSERALDTLSGQPLNASSKDLDGVEEQEPVGVVDVEATFDTLMVWNHETRPSNDDEFVRGAEEWIGIASKMHLTREPTKQDDR